MYNDEFTDDLQTLDVGGVKIEKEILFNAITDAMSVTMERAVSNRFLDGSLQSAVNYAMMMLSIRQIPATPENIKKILKKTAADFLIEPDAVRFCFALKRADIENIIGLYKNNLKYSLKMDEHEMMSWQPQQKIANFASTAIQGRF